MQVEIRKFKFKKQLLLIADTRKDQQTFEAFFGSAPGVYNSKRLVHVTICTDDVYTPYIRIDKDIKPASLKGLDHDASE